MIPGRAYTVQFIPKENAELSKDKLHWTSLYDILDRY